MKHKWNEMNQSEKIIYSIGLVFCCIGFVFAVLDLCQVWQYANIAWSITFALFTACESKLCWAKERKLAIINMIISIVLIGCSIVNLCL